MLFTRRECYILIMLLFLGLSFSALAQTYDEIAYQGYINYGKALATKDPNDFKKAGSLLQQAGVMKKQKNEIILWDAAMIYAMGKDTAHALSALEACLTAGMTDVQKVTSRPVFDFLKQLPAWESLISRFKTAEQKYIATLRNPTLRQELLQMWAEDQRDRSLLHQKVAALNGNWGAPELGTYYTQLNKNDSIHFARIKEIVKLQGWPKISEVGKDGSFAAWAIVQHSNQVLFQKACIQAMKPLLPTNEVNPIEYAELVDRVQINQKLKQVYGMAIIKENGKPGFHPIEDEEQVDQRRKAIGLEPLTVQAHLNGFKYFKPETD